MAERRTCDFCGRSETDLTSQSMDGSRSIELDGDGLWICRSCRPKLVLPAVGDETRELGELRELFGKSAGAICRSLNLPYEPPYQAVIDAAEKIAYDQDLYMSAWHFVTQWLDGTIVFHSEDGESAAFVTPDGNIRFQSPNKP